MEILPILEMSKSIVYGHSEVVTAAAMIVVRNPLTNASEEFQKWKQPLTYDESNAIKIKLDEYLDLHPEIIQRDIKIQELADLLEVPKYKLSIFFSRDMLMPYKDWLNKRRLDLFLLQLEAGALKRYSIMGLATRCGFQTKSNFYSIFKKFCGCSPFEYIENV
jgi:AraC-like DNA-binding protein